MTAVHLSATRLCPPLLALCAVLLLVSCSTYYQGALRVREQAIRGDLEGALELVDKRAGDDPDVLDLMESGLLLYYAGGYAESSQRFQLAEEKIEDLFTKSISQEALAFLTNDATLPYTGYPAEQVLIHTYSALSYLSDGDLEGALVECRKAGLRLDKMASVRDEVKGYTDDAFTEWISAMLFAEDGDANSTLVSARRAYDAYREYETLWGEPIPLDLVRDYIVWAESFGFDEEALELREKYPDVDASIEPMQRNEGELILIYGSGFVDHLRELRLDFPIFESDRSPDAAMIYSRGHRGVYVSSSNVKIKYWLSVAVPTLERTEAQLRSARMHVADLIDASECVTDVSAIFRLTWQEGEAKRMIRTIARGLAKYATVQAVDNDGRNEGLGILANIVASATERADTRSWTMLPDRLHLARLRLPAGVYPVEVEVLDGAGRVGQTASFQDVPVIAGRRTFLHHRSYR